jgi:hypothetical protein
MATRDGEAPAPTFYANFVTSILTVDDLVMELRRVDRTHREMLSTMTAAPVTAPFIPLPSITPADIMALEPIARVVLSFSAAKALKEYLDNALPAAEESRRTGKPIS